MTHWNSKNKFLKINGPLPWICLKHCEKLEPYLLKLPPSSDCDRNNGCKSSSLWRHISRSIAYPWLDYECSSKHYQLIAIDLSKPIELENPNLKQKNWFIGKLEDNRGYEKIIDISKYNDHTTGNLLDYEFSKAL